MFTLHSWDSFIVDRRHQILTYPLGTDFYDFIMRFGRPGRQDKSVSSCCWSEEPADYELWGDRPGLRDQSWWFGVFSGWSPGNWSSHQVDESYPYNEEEDDEDQSSFELEFHCTNAIMTGKGGGDRATRDTYKLRNRNDHNSLPSRMVLKSDWVARLVTRFPSSWGKDSARLLLS